MAKLSDAQQRILNYVKQGYSVERMYFGTWGVKSKSGPWFVRRNINKNTIYKLVELDLVAVVDCEISNGRRKYHLELKQEK